MDIYIKKKLRKDIKSKNIKDLRKFLRRYKENEKKNYSENNLCPFDIFFFFSSDLLRLRKLERREQEMYMESCLVWEASLMVAALTQEGPKSIQLITTCCFVEKWERK